MIFLGPDFVVTVRHGAACPLDGVRRQLEAEQRHLLREGPAAVLYAVADAVVDDYDVVADKILADIDEMEEHVFSPRGGADVQRVYQLKRELMEFNRAVTPLHRPLQQLTTGETSPVPPAIATYLRDVEDHVLRASERIVGADELVVGLLHATLTQLSVQQNDDMRKISAWAAIITVPTMIAGIYGMNFQHMPELGWVIGYPLAIGVMVAASSFLWRTFKRSGWL
jgi:magnesium transporter